MSSSAPKTFPPYIFDAPAVQEALQEHLNDLAAKHLEGPKLSIQISPPSKEEATAALNTNQTLMAEAVLSLDGSPVNTIRFLYPYEGVFIKRSFSHARDQQNRATLCY